MLDQQKVRPQHTGRYVQDRGQQPGCSSAFQNHQKLGQAIPLTCVCGFAVTTAFMLAALGVMFTCWPLNRGVGLTSWAREGPGAGALWAAAREQQSSRSTPTASRSRAGRLQAGSLQPCRAGLSGRPEGPGIIRWARPPGRLGGSKLCALFSSACQPYTNSSVRLEALSCYVCSASFTAVRPGRGL